MRVLIINKFLYPNGGSETYIFKLGEALEQHGHEVQYFGMAAVRGVHNDILKIYINFGFVGSLIWYALNLIYFPVKFMNEYGKKAATIYMALILYLFITYLTDNTESYFVCQVALLLIPITEYLKEKNRSVYLVFYKRRN